MEKPEKCSGCGMKFDYEKNSNEIFFTNDGCYCISCADKLPNYVMKKCFQCKFFDYDGMGNSYCKYARVRYICKTDDACEKYVSSFPKTNLRY